MSLLFNILFEIILFQGCFSGVIRFISYTDEIILFLMGLIFLRYVFTRYRKKALLKQEKKIIYLAFILIVIGIVGNLISNTNQANIAILKDILAISKFSLFYIFSFIATRNIDKNKLLEKIGKRCVVYINIIFMFAILNLIIDIGMHQGIRFGFRSFKFLYPHPTYLVMAMVIMMSIISASNNIDKFNKKILFMECIMIILFTFRSKGIVYIAGYLIISNIIKMNKKKEFKFRYWCLILITGIYLTYDKVIEYIYYGLTAARPALYIIGAKLAEKYFPFGSGFGTFASSLSGKYYSNIYHEYHISHIMGLTPDKYNYMADSFWPYIYGQFGVLGLIVFILIIIYVIKSINIRYKNNMNGIIASYSIFMYILIASTAEAIFTDSLGSMSFIILAIYLGENKSCLERN